MVTAIITNVFLAEVQTSRSNGGCRNFLLILVAGFFFFLCFFSVCSFQLLWRGGVGLSSTLLHRLVVHLQIRLTEDLHRSIFYPSCTNGPLFILLVLFVFCFWDAIHPNVWFLCYFPYPPIHSWQIFLFLLAYKYASRVNLCLKPGYF